MSDLKKGEFCLFWKIFNLDNYLFNQNLKKNKILKLNQMSWKLWKIFSVLTIYRQTKGHSPWNAEEQSYREVTGSSPAINKILRFFLFMRKSLIDSNGNSKSSIVAKFTKTRAKNCRITRNKLAHLKNFYVWIKLFENKPEVLTDTGEDSKLVHRRICPKVDASIFFSFFFDASKRQVFESKILASTFGRFRMYRLISS